MNYKKGMDKKYIALIVFAVVLIVLGIISNSVNSRAAITRAESLMKNTFLYTTNLVNSPIRFVSNKVEERREKNNVFEKYQKLKEKENQFDFQSNKVNALEDEVKSLKELLELNKTLTEYELVNSTIMNRNLGYFFNEITIDKGSKDGIKIDSAVVNNRGLIGKVVKVTRNTSTVELLTSNNANNRVSVKIINGETDVYGVLSGYNSENGMFEIDGIAEIVEIKEGSKVITTGLGGIYPKGIVVGEVHSTVRDNFDFAKILNVEPSVCFNEINYVSVLVN